MGQLDDRSANHSSLARTIGATCDHTFGIDTPRAQGMNEERQVLGAIKRTLGRIVLILLIAEIIACGIYATAQSSLAPTLAHAMNVSWPLIILNETVQSVFRESNRSRENIALARGLAEVLREIIVLGILIAAVSFFQYLAWQRRRKKTRSLHAPRTS